jgi:hypothetical protein
MDQLGNGLNVLLEDTKGVGIGDHQRRHFLVHDRSHPRRVNDAPLV